MKENLGISHEQRLIIELKNLKVQTRLSEFYPGMPSTSNNVNSRRADGGPPHSSARSRKDTRRTWGSGTSRWRTVKTTSSIFPLATLSRSRSPGPRIRGTRSRPPRWIAITKMKEVRTVLLFFFFLFLIFRGSRREASLLGPQSLASGRETSFYVLASERGGGRT
jgi:hypothetical protein